MNAINENLIHFSICSLSQGNAGISMSADWFRLFSCIFEKNDKGNLLCKQIANDIFRNRLHEIKQKFIETQPKSTPILLLLEGISENERFLLLPYNVNLDKTLNNYLMIKSKLHEINNKEMPFNINSKMGTLYHIYFWGDKRIYVGEPEKKERKCRFCGESHPKTTFKKKAHAISESLGNTLLFCNEECDSCNEYFGKIEQEFSNFMALFSSMNGLRGKGGIRSLKGKSFNIDNKRNIVELKAETGIDELKNNRELKIEIEESSLNYSLMNIYKCLCKFAISLIDCKHLAILSKTIEWLQLEQSAIKLPSIWIKRAKLHSHPMVGIYVRKDSSNIDIPLFVIRMFIYSLEYVFTFPFIENEVTANISGEKCREAFSLEFYTESDFSSAEIIHPSAIVTINLQEGTEIVSINRSDYENLSEEDRIRMYPNVSGFIVNNEN